MLLPKRKLFGSRNRSNSSRVSWSRPRVELLEDRLVPATYTVLNTNDSGADSLRDAITQANADGLGGTDVIDFNIAPSGVQTINLANASGPLPAITRPILIDGSSEHGFAGTPLVVIDGSALSSGDGLVISAAGSTLESLAIDNFTSGSGIVMGTFGSAGVTGNQIVGCYLGVAADGITAAPNDIGVLVDNGASDNAIGGVTAAARNILSGNVEFGVSLDGQATANVVEGNYIGIDSTGLAAVPNGRIGIIVSGGATNNIIGGTTTGARNVISANIDNEISIDGEAGSGANQNVVEGNYIGTDVTGMSAPTGANDKPDAGAIGIVAGASNNTIGGSVAGAQNLISGNGSDGVEISGVGSTGNVVAGNIIGLNVSGTSALANEGDGVFIDLSPNNIVGGPDDADRNIISGNTGNGVTLFGSTASGNTVQNNYIGTDITGKLAIGGNLGDGVHIDGAANDLIANNVISANEQNGVSIVDAGANGNMLFGNFIGVDVSSTAALGNIASGLAIANGAQNNTIGGSNFMQENVISANGADGITITDASSTGNSIVGNVIGSDRLTQVGLGNMGAGVAIQFAPNNTIGGTLTGTGNTIAHNKGAGVAIGDANGGFASGNSILQNTIYDNGNLGINSTPGTLGVFPTLTLAYNTLNALTAVASGTLAASANETYRIEFFANFAADPSGFGQGEYYMGSMSVTTDGTGSATFQANLTGPLPLGYFVSATATGPDGTTSRFSSNIQVTTPTVISFENPVMQPFGVVGPLFVKLERAGPTNGTVTVTFATMDGTAVAGTDYVAVNQTVTFAPGDVEEDVPVTLLHNRADPMDRFFQITLSNTTDGAILGGPTSATVVILGPGLVSFKDSSITTSGTAASVTLTLERTEGTGGPLSLTFQTSDGTAIAGKDYSTTSGRLTFESGVTEVSFTVPLLNNNSNPNDRFFLVNLTNNPGGAIFSGPTTATVTIPGNGSPVTTPNARYVSTLYSTLLGRTPDLDGANFWTDQISQGVSRANVALGFEFSPEGRTNMVESLYQTYLHRAADPQGLQSSVGFLSTGGTVEELKAAILSSQEYFANRAGGTNAGFLTTVYSDILGRGVDPASALLFGQALAAGAPRFAVALWIIESPEADQVLVQSLYLVYLSRSAEPAGANSFVGALQAGARDETVLAAILGSDEYFSHV